VLFGLVHASIYRFLPTGLLGAILAMTTLSSRSLWPAIALHAAYNGLLVMQGEGWTVPAASAWLALPGLALLALQLRLVQTQDQEHHANEAQQRA
jgi:membrane protease YdiL (CAAX protease family)